MDELSNCTTVADFSKLTGTVLLCFFESTVRDTGGRQATVASMYVLFFLHSCSTEKDLSEQRQRQRASAEEKR